MAIMGDNNSDYYKIKLQIVVMYFIIVSTIDLTTINNIYRY